MQNYSLYNKKQIDYKKVFISVPGKERHGTIYFGSYPKNRFDDIARFTYKKFNGDTYDLRTWKLVPAEHKKCPYFELDENMTYEKFIEMYGEIL